MSSAGGYLVESMFAEGLIAGFAKRPHTAYRSGRYAILCERAFREWKKRGAALSFVPPQHAQDTIVATVSLA